MRNKLKPFINAVVRCGVLLRTSNNWEDYQNMCFGEEDAEIVMTWLAANSEEVPENTVLSKAMDDFFRVLKTDWNIGVNQAVNAVKIIDNTQKKHLNRIIDGILTPSQKDDAGIARAVEIIRREL